MNTKRLIFIALSTASAALHAGPRTSANYSILTDSADSAGRRATSASYTNDGSAGGVAGISTVASPAELAKSGYLAQLFDVTGLTLTAALLTVNEGTTDQLAAWQALDDATFLAATSQGIHLGQTGTLGLTVKNVNREDFGAYAGDLMDDAWQVQYFGLPPNSLLKNPVGLLLLTLALALAPEAARLKMSKSKSKSKR